MLTWCSHCGRNCDISHDYTTNNKSCVSCRKILFEDIYDEEATFVKDAARGAHLTDNFSRIGGACFKSRRRTLRKGNVATNELIYKNGITEVSHAARHYKGREMIWCPHCARKVCTSHHHTTCSVCCVGCGKVLFEETYTENAPFCRKAERKKAFTSEAAAQLSMKKRSSSKINYDVLDRVFGDEPKPMKSYAIGKEPVKEDDDYS